MTRPRDFAWLKADRRRLEWACWEPWLRQVAVSRRAFSAAIDDDPMAYNETASVGVMASAASTAGMLAMAEYVCTKRHRTDFRRTSDGRADLWLHHQARDRSWAFEAKQMKAVAGSRLSTFENKLAEACGDAARIPHWEADKAYGLLIVNLPPHGAPEPLMLRLREQAELSELACRIGGGDEPVICYFRPAQRRKKQAA